MSRRPVDYTADDAASIQSYLDMYGDDPRAAQGQLPQHHHPYHMGYQQQQQYHQRVGSNMPASSVGYAGIAAPYSPHPLPMQSLPYHHYSSPMSQHDMAAAELHAFSQQAAHLTKPKRTGLMSFNPGKSIADMFRGWSLKSKRGGRHTRSNSEMGMSMQPSSPSLYGMQLGGVGHHHGMQRDTSMPTMPASAHAVHPAHAAHGLHAHPHTHASMTRFPPTSAVEPYSPGPMQRPSLALPHMRSHSARPLPAVPTPLQHYPAPHMHQPAAPRDPRLRRPTGPRDLPQVLQNVVDNKARVAAVQATNVELVQEMQRLVILLTSYVSCSEERTEAQIRETWLTIKHKTETIESNVMSLFSGNNSAAPAETPKDLCAQEQPANPEEAQTEPREAPAQTAVPDAAPAAEAPQSPPVVNKPTTQPVESTEGIKTRSVDKIDADNETAVRSRSPSGHSSSGGSEIIKQFASKLGLDVRPPTHTAGAPRPVARWLEARRASAAAE
ncbi:hypothetical protein HK105_203400 [Polyrhizophydium stewartii]|uniref:Uncharacterized protein n=1 Tax=Polyrhizophydium stewartii TaxID=2732419 RepID=A0ABR4NBT3_9FUNG